MWLTRFAISRPVIAAMVFIALAVFGTISFFKLGRSANPPNTTFPVVVVIANYPGASPQDMEKLVVKPIEDQLDGIDGLDQVSATAQEGTASVIVQFKLGTNLDLAAVDVQRRVDTARVYMPSDLDPPYVYKNGASKPLLDLAVSSRVLSPTQLADVVTNTVEPLLKQIPDVQTVDVYGAAQREFRVEPIPGRLFGVGATLSDVLNAVSQNNANLPGGRLEEPTREASVSVHAAIEHAADIAAIPLPVPGNAVKTLRVGDVATAIDGHAEQRTISRFDGSPRLYVSLGRAIGSDEITATQIARRHLKAIETQFPQLRFHEIDAPADYTQASLDGVWQSLAEGVFLTAIVMMLFLHAWRNAVVVMVSIPASILSTFIVMNLLGFHLDMMSLMGLSLIIGILVDDSIVVLENITRHRDSGLDPMAAAVAGRSEIGGAAIAITLVDVVVFLPIAFLSGIVGEYLKEFGLVVVVATLFSLFVSFTLTPLLAAKWSVKRRSVAAPRWMEFFKGLWPNAVLGALALALALLPWPYGHLVAVFAVALLVLNAFVQRYDRILDLYRSRLLPLGLRHGYFVVFVCAMLLVNALMLIAGGQIAAVLDACVAAVLLAAVALRIGGFGRSRRLAIATLAIPLVLAVAMAPLGKLNFDFVPQMQTGHIAMTVTYPPGTPIRTTSGYVDALERAIMKIGGIKSVSSTVGRKPSGWGSVVGGNYAQLDANTQAARRNETNALAAKIRKLTYLVPGGNLQVAGDGGGGSGTAIFYSISGPDNQIDAAAEKVAAFLRATPGSVNVQTSADVAAPRLNVRIDPARCAVLGVAPAAAALAARIAVDGAVATKVRTQNGLVDVRVQFPKADRSTVAEIQNVRVRAAGGTLVPLADVATFSWSMAPTRIERLNRQRVVNIFGDVLPGYSLGAVTGPLEAKLHRPGFLPATVHLTTQGDTRYMQQTMQNMLVALGTSFMLVYMLMVVLYGSFLEPLIVMFSVPLAIVGALVALAVTSKLNPQNAQSLNLISMIGIVMLFGLVAKNGILLVDYSNTLVRRGMRVKEAVLQAAATRFRPILMTTSAMVFGMLPLALGFSEGAEWRQSMGTVIIGGLLSSLILTLFLVPMIYNTWMGALERRADRRALKAEMVLEPAAPGA